jgi:hypothetical protein
METEINTYMCVCVCVCVCVYRLLIDLLLANIINVTKYNLLSLRLFNNHVSTADVE